jgi:hypothetical protein
MQWFEFTSNRPNAIPFALDAAGKWRDVSEVERGLACKCVCPECEGQLVARKGEIRVHYFAHHDLRECRHALETALFGVTIELLGAPGAVLQLPGHGDRAAWLREAAIERHIAPPAPFATGPFVIPPSHVTVPAGFQVHCHRLADSVPDVADFTVPDLKLAVHVLSHRKSYASLSKATHAPGWSILALNLNYYVKLWWETCDPDKDAKVAQAMHARDQLKRWLASVQTGRGFLQHAEESALRQRFDSWAAEARAAAAKRLASEPLARPAAHAWTSTAAPVNLAAIRAERAAAVKEMDAKWRIPTIPGVEPDRLLYQVANEPAPGVFTSWLAKELSLKWHIEIRCYVFVGRPGDGIPEAARSFILPNGKWQTLTEGARLT